MDLATMVAGGIEIGQTAAPRGPHTDVAAKPGAGFQCDGKDRFKIASAHERIELQILGDEVSHYRTYIKIPDEWRRQREELTLPRVLLSMVLPFLVLGGC